MMKRTPLLVLAIVAGIPAIAGAATARAQLQPSRLAVGSPAQLTITVDDEAKPPDVRIPDASVRYTGQMQQTTIVNGTQSQALTFLYSVVPDKTGSLDVPAIPVATAHGTVATAPVHASVANAPATSAGSPASAAGGVPPTSAAGVPATGSANTAATRDAGSHAFVRLELPKKKLVVGEAVPVTIRAYFRGGTSATLEGQPHLDSDAFTLSQLSDKPAQTEVELHGERYLQATWTGVLSPAKPTSHPLAVELPVDLAYRTHVQHQHRTLRDMFGSDAFGGDPFGDDAFADSFFDQEDPFADMFDEGPVQEQHADLRGSVGTVAVSELPVAGRPAGFTGAVGRFAVSMDAPVGDARVGEPMTVTMHVTGTGNFDRVALGGVPASAQLKTYELKSTFAAGPKPLTGDKTFTQTIVPTQAGALELPPIELAYFDPGKQAYVVATTTPATVQVAPGVATPGLATTVRDPDMVPNQLSPGEVHATLAPLVWRSGFWALPGGLLFVTVLFAGAGVWRRSSERTRRANAQAVDRVVSAAREEMHAAAERGDRTAFFAAARSAVQQRLGAAWGIAPEAVTTSDVAARDPDPELLALLEHADRVTYAADGATEPLDRWCALADRQLAHLEAA